MTKEEKFNELMQDVKIKEWYESRPEKIKELVRNYPFDDYIVKEGAPYGISAPGQKVHLYSYYENPNEVGIKVIVLAKEKIPSVIEHERYLYELHGLKMKGKSFEEITSQNFVVEVNPIWLEPNEEK